MLGLEWKDVDFENNIISVRRTSNYTAKKGVYTDTTKTRKSQRTLKFPQEIMDMLREYKAEQDEQALKCGDKWVETDRLYTKWNGEPTQTPYEQLKIAKKPILLSSLKARSVIMTGAGFVCSRSSNISLHKPCKRP